MKDEIGINAGLIWQHINLKGECSLKTLKKELKLNDAKTNLALGWLTREGKIGSFEKEGEQIYFLIF
ncbi:MAG TPA: hypothetical protein DEH02_12015 [Bacteroidales bacterium]|nr:hypothetical protein [Bacteroidales bacterium]